MAEAEPLHHTYTQMETTTVRTPNAVANRRWRLCWRIGLSVSLTMAAILITLLIVGSVGRPNADDVIVGDSPLLEMTFPIKERKHHRNSGHKSVDISRDMASRSVDEARDLMKHRKHLEKEMFDRNVNNTKRTASSYHQQANILDPLMQNKTETAVLAEMTLVILLKQANADVEDLHPANTAALLSEWVHCEPNAKPKECPAGVHYRSLDGSCNNLQSPWQGASMQPFRRIMPSVYEDGISLPRLHSVNGSVLSKARKVSRAFTSSSPPRSVDPRFSMMFLTWGQFLDHDIANTGATKGFNNTEITCCGQNDMHPECLPIYVDDTDPFYGPRGVRCLDFVRNAPAPQCQIGGREQFNQATSYIDGSMIYGMTRVEATIRLRAHVGGKLRSRLDTSGRWLLPLSPWVKDGCNKPKFMAQSRYCFASGDGRVNEELSLTAMHTVWMREHNRVANALADLNRNWDDPRIYDETRRIVIAQVQHITYNEFLPLLLGEKLMKHLKLNPLKTGYDSSYDPSVSAEVSNEFAAAAFRFGHSMVQGLIELQATGGRNVDYVQLMKLLFNPFGLWDFGTLDGIVRGNAGQCTRKMGTAFSPQMTNHLFQPEESDHGTDLFAVNIQRGRDHGLPPYYQWREICNLPPVDDWDDLSEHFKPGLIGILQSVYADVKDIDLYVGILSERHLEDAILGPVGSCIIADQFVRSKIGDRFWYETQDKDIRFTPEQLGEIRKTSLARVLCDNGDAMDALQLRVMQTADDASNPKRRCHDIPQMDLTAWEDGPLLPSS